MDTAFFKNVQSQIIISLILLLNAQAISKYRRIQKTVASLVKIVKYWAFLSESGITTWCLCVWYTQSYVCGKSCKTVSFYFQMIRYLSSLEIWLWPSQCCVFWVISSVPTPLSLPEATVPGVCSFSLLSSWAHTSVNDPTTESWGCL